MESLELEVAAAGHRYRLTADGVEVAYSDVDPIGADSVLIKHTEVPPQFEGRGYGSELLRRLLDDVRRQSKTVVPICPYAAAFMKRHPEYLDLVRESYRAAMR